MKKCIKIISFIFLLVFLLSIFSCRPRYCKGMRPHMDDVKRGIAH